MEVHRGSIEGPWGALRVPMVSLRAFWGEKWAKMGNKGENEAMGIWGVGVEWGLGVHGGP